MHRPLFINATEIQLGNLIYRRLSSHSAMLNFSFSCPDTCGYATEWPMGRVWVLICKYAVGEFGILDWIWQKHWKKSSQNVFSSPQTYLLLSLPSLAHQKRLESLLPIAVHISPILLSQARLPILMHPSTRDKCWNTVNMSIVVLSMLPWPAAWPPMPSVTAACILVKH